MNELLCVCKGCGKDMGTTEKPKGVVYRETDGTHYCAKCYDKKK